jgi:tetratricopeptide (TPR) repeat protein
VDSQTRHALKEDKFVLATKSGAGWVEDHRSTVIRWSIVATVVLLIVVVGAVLYTQRAAAAESALGAALDVYSAPLAQAGQPAQKNSFPSAADRAKAANAQFVQVANQYGWLSAGAKAHYFAGLSYEELGQTASAESQLKDAAGAWDSSLSSLAKFALAGFYHQSSRDAQAIDLYNGLIAKPTTSVPLYTSQLALADLYASAGKQEQAKALWAKVKDEDKTGSAGSIASEKLMAKK